MNDRPKGGDNMAATKRVVTPNDWAESKFGAVQRDKQGKRVRSFLRSTFPRSVKNVSWTLTDEQIATLDAWHKARQNGKPFDAAAFLKARRSRSRKSTTPNE
jgi:hypothetical protein